MQDLKPTEARTGGGERRPQALKCPRCDSLNTKFCYYNNYNLSQPRHFCKSCRRYWTKGGVLRNVPVGGGCRKPKHSSTTTTNARPKSKPKPKPKRKSETESPPEPAPATAESFVLPPGPAAFLDPCSFTSLIGAPGAEFDVGGFDYADERRAGDAVAFPFLSHRHQQRQAPATAEGVAADAATTEPLPRVEDFAADGELTALEWQSGEDLGLFDLPRGADLGHWGTNQWEDDGGSLYLP